MNLANLLQSVPTADQHKELRNNAKANSTNDKRAFSNLFSNEVKKRFSTDKKDSQIKDTTVKANKIEQKYKTVLKNKISINMTDAELYEMETKLEEAAKEAEDAINYLAALLGISVTDVKKVLSELLQDDALTSGENAGFLNGAEKLGAKNVLLLKIENLVKTLSKMADFIASSNNSNPKDMIADKLIDNEITEKQNDLKGLNIKVDKKENELTTFARIIQIIEEASEPKSADVSLSEKDVAPVKSYSDTNPKEAQSESESVKVNQKSDSETKVIDDSLNNTAEVSVKFEELVAAKSNENDKNSEAVKPDTLTKPVSIAGEEPKLVKVLNDSNNANTKLSYAEPQKSQETDKTTDKRDKEPVKKNSIIDSMKVKVINEKDSMDLDFADKGNDFMQNGKPSVELIKTAEGDTKSNFGLKDTPSFQSLLNAKSSMTLERAAKFDIISQIMEKAGSMLKDGQNILKIQLKPEHLGELFMKVSTEDGRVVAKVVTQSLMAKEALETNLYQLKESLSLQGIKIDKFNVFVGDKWQEHGGQNANLNYNYQPGSNGNGRESYGGQSKNDTLPIEAVSAANVLMKGTSAFSNARVDFIA